MIENNVDMTKKRNVETNNVEKPSENNSLTKSPNVSCLWKWSSWKKESKSSSKSLKRSSKLPKLKWNCSCWRWNLSCARLLWWWWWCPPPWLCVPPPPPPPPPPPSPPPPPWCRTYASWPRRSYSWRCLLSDSTSYAGIKLLLVIK